MDTKVFDQLAKQAAVASTRRSAIRGLIGGAIGLGAARQVAMAEDGPTVQACGIKGDDCFRNTDCCTGLKCKIGANEQSGTCVFKNQSGGVGDWCQNNKDCKRNLECDKNKQQPSRNKCKKP